MKLISVNALFTKGARSFQKGLIDVFKDEDEAIGAIYKIVHEFEPNPDGIKISALEIPISMIRKFINAELKELSNQ